jgi:hypothetical protein
LISIDPTSLPVATPIPASTGTTPTLIACGSLGPPTSLMFELSPGPHTLSLRYASCGCGPAQFSDRKLWVTPRP